MTSGERKRHMNFVEEKDGATDFNQIKKNKKEKNRAVVTSYNQLRAKMMGLLMLLLCHRGEGNAKAMG